LYIRSNSDFASNQASYHKHCIYILGVLLLFMDVRSKLVMTRHLVSASPGNMTKVTRPSSPHIIESDLC